MDEWEMSCKYNLISLTSLNKPIIQNGTKDAGNLNSFLYGSEGILND